MGSRKKNKRKNHMRSRTRRARPQAPGLLDPGSVAVLPVRAEKMSEVLMDFLEPYSERWRNEDELRKLLSIAIVAWNAALLKGSKRDEWMQRLSETVPPEARQVFRVILEEMIRRKESHFAGNQRMILDYDLTMGPAVPRLSVTSTFGSI